MTQFKVGQNVQMLYKSSGEPMKGFQVDADKGKISAIMPISDRARARRRGIPEDATHELWVRSTRIYLPNDPLLDLKLLPE